MSLKKESNKPSNFDPPMSNPEEHKEFYYVDPGIGRKLHNCPYSLSKEGNDIRDFIIPPKGYEISGFIFFPREHEGDSFYDGKIVAQYKKKPLLPRLVKPSLYLLGFLGIVGMLGILAYFLNSRPKPAFEITNTQKPNTGSPVVSSDSTLQTQVYCTSSSNTEVVAEQQPEEAVVGKESEEAIVEKEQKKEVLAEKKPEKDIVKTEQKEVLVQKEQKEVPVEKKPEKDIVKQEQKEVLAEKEQKEVPVEKKPEKEKEEILTKTPFQQEFWDLIHKRAPQMDSYHNLYVNNKGKVKGEEFDYLRLVILQNTKAYKEWLKKLKAVPESELQNINTIAALRDALK